MAKEFDVFILQALIDVCSPLDFIVVDLNCGMGIFFHPSFVFLNSKLFCNLLCLLLLHLIILIGNNIRACQALGRLILALKVDSKIFHEVFKPFLHAKSSKNIVKHGFNLDEDSPI